MSRITSSHLAMRILPPTSAASSYSVFPVAAAAVAAASFPSKEAAAETLPLKEAAAASVATSLAGDPSPALPQGAGKAFNLLKAGILTALTATVGATGYVTYAYSVEEVDQMTREFRKNSKHPIPEDLSGFEIMH